jgi:hypothetical protein
VDTGLDVFMHANLGLFDAPACRVVSAYFRKKSASLIVRPLSELLRSCVKISRHFESFAIPIRSAIRGHPVIRDMHDLWGARSGLF